MHAWQFLLTNVYVLCTLLYFWFHLEVCVFFLSHIAKSVCWNEPCLNKRTNLTRTYTITTIRMTHKHLKSKIHILLVEYTYAHTLAYVHCCLLGIFTKQTINIHSVTEACHPHRCIVICKVNKTLTNTISKTETCRHHYTHLHRVKKWWLHILQRVFVCVRSYYKIFVSLSIEIEVGYCLFIKW